MKVCVFGLWHLGCVTSACLAELGFEVIGLDFDESVIEQLNESVAPISEPGLNELINKHINRTLRYTSDIKAALIDTDFIWVTFDTPVDEDDNADVDFVFECVNKLYPYIEKELSIVVSSQLPVGSTQKLNELSAGVGCHYKPSFAYSPENLRLGDALNVFLHPDRIIVGAREKDRIKFQSLFEKISDNLIWMRIESSEMTKHAINAFLATSAVFANEVATLCEYVNADAKEVEIGLKTEQRIGKKAYVAPGAAVSGGTLNRDMVFLNTLSEKHNFSATLLKGVKESNQNHKYWALSKMKNELGLLKGKKIGILGLTYKAGTNTLRRSLAVELCAKISQEGADIYAFDPSINEIDDNYKSFIYLAHDIDEVFCLSDCVAICTQWDDFRHCLNVDRIKSMRNPLLIDINSFLREAALQFGNDIKYIALGDGKKWN